MLLQDLRYALRQLHRAPGFAATVVLTLALGVGVATAVFCVIDAVILRPLPYAQPDRIVAIQSQSRSGYAQGASWPSFKDERAQARSFTALAAYRNYYTVLNTPSSGPVHLSSVPSTDNFFKVFGVQPLLGRTYLPGEEQAGRNNVAVLSYDAWQTYFGGDRNVIDRAITLDGRVSTVIGVMPAGFRFPLNMRDAIYTPTITTLGSFVNSRGDHWLKSVARIEDGVSIDQAQADLRHVFANIGAAYPKHDGGRTVRLEPVADSVTSKSRGPLWTLLGAVLAVLLIGCVNVAGLLLARGVKREREMGMRVAIGAGRARLLGQVLTEGLVLAALGAAGGVLVAWTMLDLMRAFLIHALERGADIHLNWVVLAAAVGAAVAAALASSLYPALRLSAIDPNRALKAGGSAGTGRAQHRLRSGFIVTQVALTMVLVAVAGLLIRMVTRYRDADLGFNPARILTTEINLLPTRYQDRNPVADFYQPLFDRVAQIPGVRTVGAINILPIVGGVSDSTIHVAGQPPSPSNETRVAEDRYVSAGYFNVFGIPLREGRLLSPSLDRPDNAAPTVVVNEAFVKEFIPAGLDPTAQRMDDDPDSKKWTRIVGVAGNVRQDIYQPPLAEHDWLIDELPADIRNEVSSNMQLVLRFDGSAASIVPALRSAIHQIDPTVPFMPPETMTEVVSETLIFERMESWLFGIFAALALLLALVGLYGLVSHEVEQGTRDIGIRMALGATRNRIVFMTLGRVAWMVCAGVAAGLALTVIARRLIGVVIYFDAQKEAGAFALLALGLIAAGLVAALIPAMRAARIEPIEALRNE